MFLFLFFLPINSCDGTVRAFLFCCLENDTFSRKTVRKDFDASGFALKMFSKELLPSSNPCMAAVRITLHFDLTTSSSLIASSMRIPCCIKHCSKRVKSCTSSECSMFASTMAISVTSNNLRNNLSVLSNAFESARTGRKLRIWSVFFPSCLLYTSDAADDA